MIFLICMFMLTFCSGFCEGVMDKLQFHYHKSIFVNFPNTLFWNPADSWKNKYKNGNPVNGEKFLFSTSFLVSLTDGWHLFKLIRTFLLFISLVFIGYLGDDLSSLIMYLIIARTLYGIGFYVSYNKLLKK